MSNEIKIITNNVPRFTIDDFELTPAERADFDYLDWPAIDDGRDSATFFRYRGELYDLGQFMVTSGIALLAGWGGYLSDSFFSGIVIRFPDPSDSESVVVGRYCS